MAPGRVLVSIIMGLVGGIVTELIDMAAHLTLDPVKDPVSGQLVVPDPGWRYWVLGLVIGLCYGAALGVVDGIYSGSRAKFWRATLATAVGGMLLGLAGLGIGSLIYGHIGGDPLATGRSNAGVVVLQVLARSIGWAVMGLFVGMVGGLPTLSLRRARNGAIGGLIGGGVGGFVFESLQAMSTFQPFQIRLVGFALLGAAIGFFVGLVGEVFKQAWVRVLVGRNEGREHVIDSPVAVIGRDELADIPIFLDPVLAPRQASIRFQDGRYLLYDEAGRADTRLRGQPLPAGQGLPLSDGDVIQVGRVSLAFHEKATAVPGSHRVAAPVAVVPRPGGAVCEFCGVARDPVTGACACSVAGAAPMPAPGTATVYADPAAYPPQQAENPFAPYMNAPAQGQDAGWGAAPRGMGSVPQLVAIAGPYAGHVFPLGVAVVAIGRDPARDIALPADSMTSRQHATVYAQGGVFMVRDEGSSNGTFVNGARIVEQPLYPGDELRVGGTTFRFEG